MNPLKIATWNINSFKVRLPHVLTWLEDAKPDVLALQELKLETANFPYAELQALGYHLAVNGQKTYNGVAFISLLPMQDILTDIPQLDDPQRRIIAATINGIRVINLYVPNGEDPSSSKYIYKLEWLTAVTQFIQQQLAQYPNLIVLGDFNIAPEAVDVHDPLYWQDKVLFSPPERDAFQQLLQLGLQDSFRLFPQAEKIYSWWDYRMLAFRRNHGLRIDHILVSSALAQKCVACSIDKQPRKWERPSDHAPVIACFENY